MGNLNDTTNDEIRKEYEDKKHYYYQRYASTINRYACVGNQYESKLTKLYSDVDSKNISDMDINILSGQAQEYKDFLKNTELKIDDYIDELIQSAISMYEGKEEFNKDWFFKLFEKLYNHEIVEILAHNDFHNLCSDKDSVLELMERSGAVCEIACFSNEGAIKQILEDRDLLEKIYKNEVLTSSNLNGDEILSLFLLQLEHFKELTQDQEFMTGLLKNVGDIYDDVSNAFGVINYVIAQNCEKLLQERDFSESVFNFIEKITEKSRDTIWYPTEAMVGLAKKMLLTPELASDEELAKRYVKDFKYLYNIDKSFLKNKDFMEMVLDECEPVVFDNFELPLEFYSDPNILEKYLKAKTEWGINGINFDFDNDLFADLYEQSYGESIEDCMRQEIENVIEKNKAIVVNEENSSEYDDVISVIQQWAQDSDLIRIGEKLDVIKVPKGEIIKGKLNIGNGENKNTIDDSSVLFSTIVLDGNNVADVLRKIGIDTRINIDKKQELYDESIEIPKQKREEDFLEKVSDLASQKKVLKEKEKGAKELLKQYEQLNQNNEKSVSDE